MREPQQPVTKTEQPEGGILYDFGKEKFGFITLKNLSGKGKIEIYYGESPEEAKDKAYCETLDKLLLEPGQVTDLAIRSTSPLSNSENEYTLENSKAFRYVYVTHEPSCLLYTSANIPFLRRKHIHSFIKTGHQLFFLQFFYQIIFVRRSGLCHLIVLCNRAVFITNQVQDMIFCHRKEIVL